MYCMGTRSSHVKAHFLGERTHPIMPDDTAMSCAKIAEPIGVPFGLWTWVGPRKHVLVGCTIEPCMCSGTAAFFVKLL